MRNLLTIQEWLIEDPNAITSYSKICDSAYEFTVYNKEIFIVCDEDGAEEILNEYRDASIKAALQDIPEVYHDFFDFGGFADYSWQTVYDIYDKVDEVYDETGKKYYICSV